MNFHCKASKLNRTNKTTSTDRLVEDF